MAGWTSVQIVTIVVAALTPLTVAALGFLVARTGRRIGQVQWANQTVVARRLDIFKEVAPLINQLLCFGSFIGGWKEISPRKAIEVKRKLDETMFANRLLFSDQFFGSYQLFMATLFAMYATTDADAHIRAPINSVWGDRRNMSWWEDGMESLFSTRSTVSTDDIQAAHDRLAQRFRAELYVTQQALPLLET